MDVVKICGVTIAALVFILVLERFGSPLRGALTAGAVVAAVSFCVPKIKDVISFAQYVEKSTPSADAFPVVLKVTSVALICEVTANICDGAGETSLSRTVIAAGRIEALFLSLPLIKELFEQAVSLVRTA